MMEFRLKHGSLLIVMLVIALVCFGCQPPSKLTRVTPRSEKVELEFWTLQMLNFKDYIEGMIANYEKAHPHVTIKWVDVPFSEGEKKALTSMLANKTPDIINLNPDFSAVLASRDALVDMNRYVPAKQRDSFLPVAWQAASLDRETFGIPWYLSSAVTLYNQQLLKAAGYNAPPKTYAEMAAMGKAMRAKKVGYILMPSITDGGRFFRVLQKQGLRIWDENHHLVFADNGADKELAFWVNLFQQGLVPSESLTEGQQAAVDHYQSGSLAMLLTGPNFLNIVKENAPKIFQVTRVAPQFPQKSSYMDFSEMVLVVPKRSSHPQEAVDFALYVANPENTLKLSELAPVLPPHKEALKAPAFQKAHSKDLLEEARSISAQQLLMAKTALQIHPMQNRLNQLMDYYVQSALLAKLSPDQAMRKAQDEMNKLIAE